MMYITYMANETQVTYKITLTSKGYPPEQITIEFEHLYPFLYYSTQSLTLYYRESERLIPLTSFKSCILVS